MKIHYAEPADKGVTALMYVGDDNAIDQALAPAPHGELVLGVLALVVAVNSRGLTQAVAGGVLGAVIYGIARAPRAK